MPLVRANPVCEATGIGNCYYIDPVDGDDEMEIVGTITAVSQDVASINIGSAHGVVKGMKMTIYRGGMYVGTIRIEDVKPRVSAGIITQANLPPVKGDKVASRMSDPGATVTAFTRLAAAGDVQSAMMCFTSDSHDRGDTKRILTSTGHPMRAMFEAVEAGEMASTTEG